MSVHKEVLSLCDDFRARVDALDYRLAAEDPTADQFLIEALVQVEKAVERLERVEKDLAA